MDNYRVLVVDDNATNLKLLREFFDEKGYDGFYALNGIRAMEIAFSTVPDLILLDVMMPDMDGFAVCKKLKENPALENTPIIFMTALNDTESKVRGFELGAVDFISKPFEMAEVHARIKNHLRTQDLIRDQLANNKFKAKIFSMLSHELRSPMTVISLRSQLIERLAVKSGLDKIVGHCSIVRDSVKRATDMLGEFLLLGRSELKNFAFEPEEFDAKELCNKIIHETELMCDNTYRFDFTFESEATTLFADPNLLHHVISNLLSNAVKYAPGTESIEVSYTNNGSEAVFTVRDFGIGIPEKDQSTLFEAFHRAENVGQIQGTGLGLSIAKQFVDLHDGVIDFESNEEKGTIFKVTIPINVQ